jgi:hypothetical protein
MAGRRCRCGRPGRTSLSRTTLPGGRSLVFRGGPMLGICPLKQGVGLDFVRKREYGRLRWLNYPAKTKKMTIKIDCHR